MNIEGKAFIGADKTAIIRFLQDCGYDWPSVSSRDLAEFFPLDGQLVCIEEGTIRRGLLNYFDDDEIIDLWFPDQTVFTGIETLEGAARLQKILIALGYDWPNEQGYEESLNKMILLNKACLEYGKIYHSPDEDENWNYVDVSWLEDKKEKPTLEARRNQNGQYSLHMDGKELPCQKELKVVQSEETRLIVELIVDDKNLVLRDSRG